jgi:ferredoxin-type protein NapH
MRYAKIRSFVGTCVLGGIVVAAFVGFPFSGCNYLKIGFLRFVCPVGFLETTLASHTISWKLVPGFLIECVLVLLLGRTYCSWLCPAAHARVKSMGFVTKFLPITFTRTIERKWQGFKQHSVGRLHLEFRDGLALILGGAVGIAVFGYPFFCLWCPIGILSRSLIELGKHYTPTLGTRTPRRSSCSRILF